MPITRAEICRRCNCSRGTIERRLEPVDWTKSGRPLYDEEDVLDFAVQRAEDKERRDLAKAHRVSLREKYESDPEYREAIDSRTEKRRENRARKRALVLEQPIEMVSSWAKKGYLKTLFNREERENLVHAGGQ